VEDVDDFDAVEDAIEDFAADGSVESVEDFDDDA